MQYLLKCVPFSNTQTHTRAHTQLSKHSQSVLLEPFLGAFGRDVIVQETSVQNCFRTCLTSYLTPLVDRN